MHKVECSLGYMFHDFAKDLVKMREFTDIYGVFNDLEISVSRFDTVQSLCDQHDRKSKDRYIQNLKKYKI